MSKRVIRGTVVSDKMDKTVVVSVERRTTHPLYRKVVRVTKRYKAHDDSNTCRMGDVVDIIESAPVSRDKRWRVIDVLSRGDVAEIAPDEIGREIEEEMVSLSQGLEEQEAPAKGGDSEGEAVTEQEPEAEE
ncbi:MAG TPA: 30S ribosomal protein S17 [Dehalococcoidia bacterium]|nr:30S ribosomal protein S17 [Dehalococcoidia bacterium]